MTTNEQLSNIRFVQEVEKYPCLYNYKFDSYSRRDNTDTAWEVSKAVNEEASTCKERWRNLRTVFARKLKPARSGSGRKSTKPYYLLEAMQFILPYVKVNTPIEEPSNLPSPPPVNENFDNHQESDEHEDNDQESQRELDASDKNITAIATTARTVHSENPTPSAKTSTPNIRKRSSVSNQADQAFVEFMQSKKQKKTNEEDSRRLFLLSLLPDIHKLSDTQMRTFRRRVLAVLDEVIENPVPDYLAFPQYSATPSPSYTQHTDISRSHSLPPMYDIPTNFNAAGQNPHRQGANVDSIDQDLDGQGRNLNNTDQNVYHIKTI